MVVAHNKLVRDNMPKLIEAKGDHAIWKTVSGTDFRHVLLMKVIEEAREYSRHTSAAEECDVQEVLLKARQIYDYSEEEVTLSHKVGVNSGQGFGQHDALYHAADYIKNPSADCEAELQESIARARALAGYTTDEVEEIRSKKAAVQGVFEEGVYLLYTD